MSGRIGTFRSDDSGAVASDITLLIGGMIALAIAVAAMTSQGSNAVAGGIMQSLSTATVQPLVFEEG